MTPAFGAMLTVGCAVLALRGWFVSRASVRHDALVLIGIAVYFGIGTMDLAVVPAAWSPRYSVTPQVWVVAGLGALAYYLGAMLGRRSAPAAPAAPAPRVEAHLEGPARFLCVTGMLALLALTVASRAPLITGVNREGAGGGYLTALALLLVPGLLLRLALRRGRWVRRDWIWFLAAALLLLVTEYRTYTLLLGLSVGLLTFLDTESPRRRWKLVLGGAALTLVVGVVFGYLRFTQNAGGNGADLVRLVLGSGDPTLWRMAVAYVFYGFFREGPAILGFIIERHPMLVPYTHGRALLAMLTSPLPGVQVDARGILSREVYGMQQTSLVSSIFGPWYLDFGRVGVVVAMLVLGWILSRLEMRAFRRRDGVARAAYAYALVVMILAIHTGLSDFAYLVMIPLAFLWASSQARSPTPEAVPQQGE